MTAAWRGYLGGAKLRRAATRRIDVFTIACALLVIGLSVARCWPWRPAVAVLLFVQVSGIVARLYLAYEAYVHLVMTDDGIGLVRHRRPLWFVSWDDIAAASQDGADVCIALTNGGVVRVGIDATDALKAIHTRCTHRARGRAP